MENYKDEAELFLHILRAAVKRRVNLVRLRPAGRSYEVKWERGARSVTPTIIKMERSTGEKILEYVIDKGELIPFDAKSEQTFNDYEKPIFFDLDANTFAACKAHVMNTLGGVVMTLDIIFPTPLESWQDLDFTSGQVAALRRNLEKEGGMVCFNNIYLEQTAHAVSWLSIQELKRRRAAEEIAHIAEAFFHPDTDHLSHQIELGNLEKIFEEAGAPAGNGLVIEPVLRNYHSIDLSEFFKLASDKRLVVINGSDVDLDDFLHQVKKMPAVEQQKLRLMVHIEETDEECQRHDAKDIEEVFDLDLIDCQVCDDTGTANVSFQVKMIEFTPDVTQALIDAKSALEFCRMAEEKGWFIN